MSKIRSSNTKPELIVRRFLFAKGFRYRIHQKSLPGKPDIVLKKHNAIVLVHGCFWHGHQDENCKKSGMPETNLEYWKPKIEKNISKDIQMRKELEEMGWRVIVVWECELNKSRVGETLNQLMKEITAEKTRQ